MPQQNQIASAERVWEAAELCQPVHYEDVVTWHRDERIYRVTRTVNGKRFIAEVRADTCPGLGACSWGHIVEALRTVCAPVLDRLMAAAAAA